MTSSGRARIDTLRPVAIEDLLGRDPVPPVPELLGPGLRDAVVCVTGAVALGSSPDLGAEPQMLILLESSEPSLYVIDHELRQNLADSVTLVPVLGIASDSACYNASFQVMQFRSCFTRLPTNVPLVEANPLAGLANNVGSTRVVCQVAVSTGVSELMVISTDRLSVKKCHGSQ